MRKTNVFNEIIPFYSYSVGEIIGEVDLLAIGEESGWYEIKYRHSPKRLDQAIERFRRFKKAFPNFIGRGYYISCDGFAIEITNINRNEKEDTINNNIDKL